MNKLLISIIFSFIGLPLLSAELMLCGEHLKLMSEFKTYMNRTYELPLELIHLKRDCNNSKTPGIVKIQIRNTQEIIILANDLDIKSLYQFEHL